MKPITINDQPHKTAAPHLLGLMQELGLVEKKALALALNELVIPQEEWPLTPLAPGDRILLIRATQGG